VLVALTGVPPDELVDADDPHPVQALRVADQDPAAFGQDSVVGGVPRDPKTLGDPGDRQLLADDRRERPTQPASAELRARRRRTVTSSVVGRQPNGSWASSRVTLPRGDPRQQRSRHHWSDSATRQVSAAHSG